MALDQQIVSEFSEFSQDVQRLMSGYYREAAEDLRFYAGRLLSAEEESKLMHQNRNAYQVNKIRRVINLYSGYERENRVSTIIGAQEEGDEELAEQLSAVMLYTYDHADVHSSISDCFDHCLKTGLGIVGISIDYTKDRINGDIKSWFKPYNAFLIDPYFTKRDLSDAERCATRDLLSKEQVKALLPFVDPSEIDGLPSGNSDLKFPYYSLNGAGVSPASRDRVTYDRYWVRKDKKVRLLVDMKTGEQIDITDFEEEQVNILLLQLAEEDVQIINTSSPTVELHIIAGGQLLYTGKDPTSLDTYPFRPILCYFEPYLDQFDLKIQGVVRSQKDPQRLYNRRINQVTDWLETKIHTGFKIVNGAVQDPNMLFQTGQSRLIVVNQGFDPVRDVQQLDASDLPGNVLQHMQLLDKDILDVSGVNETQLGVDEGGNTQVSGKLAQVRSSGGMTGSRGIFDNYEFSLKSIGQMILEAIQKNYSSEKIERIIGKPVVPQISSKMIQPIDITIKQSVLTKTQREAYYFELLRLRELGVGIPDSEILDASPIQGKSSLRKMIDSQEQQAQAQAQIEEEARQRTNALSDAALESEIARKEAETARATSQTGLFVERIARSEQDRASAGLNRAKTMAELQGLRADQLAKLLQLLQLIEKPLNDFEETKNKEFRNENEENGERSGSVLKEQEFPPGA